MTACCMKEPRRCWCLLRAEDLHAETLTTLIRRLEFMTPEQFGCLVVSSTHDTHINLLIFWPQSDSKFQTDVIDFRITESWRTYLLIVQVLTLLCGHIVSLCNLLVWLEFWLWHNLSWLMSPRLVSSPGPHCEQGLQVSSVSEMQLDWSENMRWSFCVQWAYAGVHSTVCVSEPRQWLFVAVARVLDQPGCQWPTVTLFFLYPLIHSFSMWQYFSG